MLKLSATPPPPPPLPLYQLKEIYEYFEMLGYELVPSSTNHQSQLILAGDLELPSKHKCLYLKEHFSIGSFKTGYSGAEILEK